MKLELVPCSKLEDVSGFAMFSQGDVGDAHVMAHQLLDEGRYALGHRLLGDWLAQHDGAGSRWTHLQWHMSVFEIAVGDWEAAHRRFRREILPVAAQSFDALTDAPSLLWRLKLAAPHDATLHWDAVRDTARLRLATPADPYVELHCSLAFAGAGDLEALDQWSYSHRCSNDAGAQLLAELGAGLRAFAVGNYGTAAITLARSASKVSLLGGSHAQNQLFTQIAESSWVKAQTIRRAA